VERTVSSIQQEHSSRLGAILGDYQDAVDAIRAQAQPEGGMYLDRLDGQQQRALLREQKQAKAVEAHNKVRAAYKAEVERYHSELAQRRGELQRQIFGVSGSDSAEVLARAALASEDELAMLMDLAATTGNNELAKAAFVVADHRGQGDLVDKYFDAAGSDARGLYQEWCELLDEETITRRAETADSVIPAPRNLMTEPAVATY